MVISNEKGNPFGEYCGELSGKTVAVTGNFAVVQFISRFANQRKGYVIHFTAVLSSEYKNIYHARLKKAKFKLVYLLHLTMHLTMHYRIG